MIDAGDLADELFLGAPDFGRGPGIVDGVAIPAKHAEAKNAFLHRQRG
jgi:hypothetical protein